MDDLREKVIKLCNLAVDGSCLESGDYKCPYPNDDDKCGLCFADRIIDLLKEEKYVKLSDSRELTDITGEQHHLGF